MKLVKTTKNFVILKDKNKIVVKPLNLDAWRVLDWNARTMPANRF